jgi:hypothetical protein
MKYIIYIIYMSAGSGASNLDYGNITPLSNVNGSYVNVNSSQYSGSFSSNEIPGFPGLIGAKSNIDAAAGNVPGICLFKGGAKKLKRKIKNITKQYKRMKAGSRRIKTMKRKLRGRTSSRRLARSLSGGRKRRTKSRRIARSLAGGRKRRNKSRRIARYLAGGDMDEGDMMEENIVVDGVMSEENNSMNGAMDEATNGAMEGGRRKRRQRGGYAQYQNNMPLTPTYQVAGINLPASQLALASPPPITALSNCTNCVDSYNHYTNMGFPSKGH